MMTIQFLKIVNVKEMNPLFLLDPGMVLEAPHFCISDSSPNRDSDRATNKE